MTPPGSARTIGGQATGEVLAGIVPFDRSCWHTVDPGTVLFTGSLNQNIGCSGTWLATYEYVIDDVNKWWFLARSGRIAGATSLATHGDLSRSPRHRSHEAFGIGDELRVSFVIGGTYWAAASLLRDAGERWFTEDEVRCLASLSEPIADVFRRAPLVTLAYGLSERESQVTRLCMQGLSTRQMANALAWSPHTVQDHLKSIFAKTGSGAAASWSARSSWSTTCPAGKTSRTRLPAGSRRHHRSPPAAIPI